MDIFRIQTPGGVEKADRQISFEVQKQGINLGSPACEPEKLSVR